MRNLLLHRDTQRSTEIHKENESIQFCENLRNLRETKQKNLASLRLCEKKINKWKHPEEAWVQVINKLREIIKK